MKATGKTQDFIVLNRDYVQCIKGFDQGSADITFLTLFDFISLHPLKHPGKVLAITDYSHGGDKVILRNSIAKPKDIRGKKVILASDTISLWVLHLFLKSHGMDLDDVVIVHQKPALVGKQFAMDKSIAMAVGWNPKIEGALVANDARVIASSVDFPQQIYDIMVVDIESYRKNSSIYEQFMNNYYKSLNNDAVIKAAAERLFVSSAEYRRWMGDAFLFYNTSQVAFEREKLKKLAKQVSEFLSVMPESLKDTPARKLFRKRQLNENQLFIHDVLQNKSL
nr:ABC transporter substrate-binding protein [Pleionea sp. CnH1-48]